MGFCLKRLNVSFSMHPSRKLSLTLGKKIMTIVISCALVASRLTFYFFPLVTIETRLFKRVSMGGGGGGDPFDG